LRRSLGGERAPLNWKQKAAVQRLCAILPLGRDQIYYLLQRYCGGLVKGYDPLFMLSEAARMSASLRALGVQIEGARVMEVGTGWRLDMPIGLYMCGAHTIHTYDTHRYLRESLAMRSVEFLRANRARVLEMLLRTAPAKDTEQRLDALCRVQGLTGLMEVTGIQYHSPANAADTGLDAGSIDVQISYTVFEHIPGPTLESILQEANRILSSGGVAIHHIDLSDHFFQVDRDITAINFLRYSDAEWARYSGNQWAYHNRLRAYDYERIYRNCGQKILKWSANKDERSLRSLLYGFPLDRQFRDISAEALCTIIVEAVSAPRGAPTST
jgi:hypothetical protein